MTNCACLSLLLLDRALLFWGGEGGVKDRRGGYYTLVVASDVSGGVDLHVRPRHGRQFLCCRAVWGQPRSRSQTVHTTGGEEERGRKK